MPTRPPAARLMFSPPPARDARGSAASRGYDAAWRRFREAFLADHPLCCFRDDPRHRHACGHAATVVDHIRPLTQGGARLDRANCRPVCRRAHEVLTQNLKDTGRNELPAVELALGFWVGGPA